MEQDPKKKRSLVDLIEVAIESRNITPEDQTELNMLVGSQNKSAEEKEGLMRLTELIGSGFITLN